MSKSSKLSLDIVDQSLSAHRWGFVTPAACPSPSPRCDNGRRIEGQPVTVTEPDRSASLIIALTGFHLLNIASIVVFGIWKVLLAGDGRLVVVTKVELGLVMLSSVILYYLTRLAENSPEICPSFFQVDLVPPICKFLFRVEVYLFLLSLLPLLPAVATLRSALDLRHRLELGNRSPSSAHAAAENALVTAIVGLIFATIPTLQQLTKVLRLRAIHRFLVHDLTTLSLLALWAASDFYVLFNTMISVRYVPEEDDEYLFGHTMTMIPFALLLPQIEVSVIGPPWFRLLKGLLIIVVLFAWVLSEKLRSPYYASFVCGIMIFFFLRFLTVAAALRNRHSLNRHCCVQGDTDSLW